MNKKIDVEVVIGGKQYTLSGYESSEYLQRIATHINGKINEFRAQEGYARLETEMKNILLAINLSDDYQKAQNTIQDLRQENADMEKELFDMKHEMISMQKKLQEAQNAQKDLEQEKSEAGKRIIRLETELEQLQKELADDVTDSREEPHEAADVSAEAEDISGEAEAAQRATSQETEETSEGAQEDVAKEIAASIGKPAAAKKTSRSSRKKRR